MSFPRYLGESNLEHLVLGVDDFDLYTACPRDFMKSLLFKGVLFACITDQFMIFYRCFLCSSHLPTYDLALLLLNPQTTLRFTSNDNYDGYAASLGVKPVSQRRQLAVVFESEPNPIKRLQITKLGYRCLMCPPLWAQLV